MSTCLGSGRIFCNRQKCQASQSVALLSFQVVAAERIFPTNQQRRPQRVWTRFGCNGTRQGLQWCKTAKQTRNNVAKHDKTTFSGKSDLCVQRLCASTQDSMQFLRVKNWTILNSISQETLAAPRRSPVAMRRSQSNCLRRTAIGIACKPQRIASLPSASASRWVMKSVTWTSNDEAASELRQAGDQSASGHWLDEPRRKWARSKEIASRTVVQAAVSFKLIVSAA